MNDGIHNFEQDVAKIQQISIIPTILNVICQTTKMGFAAVARVTNERWIACSVLDNVNFGLKPGDELQIESTICHEIRESRQLVAFDNADEDSRYKNHHTPRIYGLKSYISVPIFTKNGAFFGTLCAIDPEPKQVNNQTVIDTFKLFTELISFHIDALETLETTNMALENEKQLVSRHEKKIERQDLQITIKNEQLLRSDSRLKSSIGELVKRDDSILKLNEEISTLAYVSSHDLQEPLRKIQMFSSMIIDAENTNLSGKSFEYIRKIQSSAKRLQSLVTDLLTYNRSSDNKNIAVSINIKAIITDVIADFEDDINEKDAIVSLHGDCEVHVIPFQIHQLIYNLISNSLQFSGVGRQLKIDILCRTTYGKETGLTSFAPEKQFCHITVKDNGIGFDQQFNRKIFELFERLIDDHKIEGTGIGLAIVKKIVDNHNGYITASGEENKGATFDIYLPL